MKTASLEDRLLELLVQWDELQRQGLALAPEELCASCPELVDELRRRIEILRNVGLALDVPSAESVSTPGIADFDPLALPKATEGIHASSTYWIERHHARGGLGEVLAARQEELGRVVAFKRIRPDRFHEASRRRFLREAAITARLQHPGIVPIYGLGQDDDGPFYTMPFIQGQTLRQAIEAYHGNDHLVREPDCRNPRLRDILQHFKSVCNTIAYAHDQGVVHRDLKPSNIMLGPYGETLVMDWGLAKQAGTEGLDADAEQEIPRPSPSPDDLTTTGAVLGTPQYMSPEQAKGEHAGPHSDIFSLGVILYSILTGKSPYDETKLRSGDPLQPVRETAIVPPRSRDPRLPRSLEAICLKALSARPANRYASGRDLARDIEDWLADEPVSAWREPASTRALRWARRNRTVVASFTAAMLAGLVGLSALAVLQSRTNGLLSKAGEETKESLQRARTAIEFLQNDVLAAARPKGRLGGIGKNPTIREALDLAEPKIARTFIDQPIVEADIRHVLGETYYYLGDAPAAIRQLERAVKLRQENRGPDHPDTLSTRNNLGLAYLDAGQTASAVSTLEETVRLSESTLGPDHLDTLVAQSSLGNAYHAAGRDAEALRIYERTLKHFESMLGPDESRTLAIRGGLAATYDTQGRTEEAIQLNEGTLRLLEKTLGPDNPETLTVRGNLASAYHNAGRVEDAVKMHEGTLQLFEKTLGPEHPDTLTSRNGLAISYRASGRSAEAIRMHEGTLRLREKVLGADHPHSIQSRNNLAVALIEADRVPEAIALLEISLEQAESKLGPDDAITLTGRNALANAYRAVGRPEDAARLDEVTLRRREATLGTDHPLAILSRHNLAMSLFQMHRLTEAITLWEQVVPSARRVNGPSHPETLIFSTGFATAQESMDRWVEAEALRREILKLRRGSVPAQSPLLTRDLDGLANNLLKQSKYEEAESLLRESLAIHAKAMPEAWPRFYSMSLLGEALLSRHDHAGAEPFIVPGYEGMKARETKIPVPVKPRLLEAAGRVVRLYDAWGKPEQTAVWKARLGLYDLPADVFARP